jgi:hypothetical protein
MGPIAVGGYALWAGVVPAINMSRERNRSAVDPKLTGFNPAGICPCMPRNLRLLHCGSPAIALSS